MKIKTKSLVFKVTLLYVIITFLNVTIFNIIVWENQTELIMENAILESQHKGTSIKYSIANIIKDTSDIDKEIISKITKEASLININQYHIISENGKRLYSRTKSDQTGEITLDELRMVNRALTQNSFEGHLFTHRLNQEERTIDLFIPFIYKNKNSAVFYTTLTMKDINDSMNQLYRECIVISTIIIIIHILFAATISKMLLVPLRRLLHATQEISHGNFNTRVPITGNDELGMLARSFNEMSTAVANMQDEAKGANPLTGLPGNVTISTKIDQHLENGDTFAVLYCDLDNFKAYNDKYGFIKGDEAILYCKQKLIEASQSLFVHDIFVGHEGGDDFVVISPYDCWEQYTQTFIEIFDCEIDQFYNSTDAKNGYISSVNRQGEAQQFPLMSMSIAVVANKIRSFTHHGEVVQVAAEVKKYVKNQDGSCYKIDQRGSNRGEKK